MFSWESKKLYKKYIYNSFLKCIVLEYILNKKIDKKNKMINRTKSFESLKNKLLYLIFKNSSVQNNILEITKLILAIIITLIEIKLNSKYKPRIRKRPQKNHYNSNIT